MLLLSTTERDPRSPHPTLRTPKVRGGSGLPESTLPETPCLHSNPATETEVAWKERHAEAMG